MNEFMANDLYIDCIKTRRKDNRRNVVPRKGKFFRGTFEILLHELANLRIVQPFVKKVAFSIWVLAKPFLAAGDLYGLPRNSAHNYFKEVVTSLVTLIPQVIRWPVNYQESITDFQERSHGITGVVEAIDGSHNISQ